MHHFVTEMCTRVHISLTNWRIVGYGTGAFWDLCNRSTLWRGNRTALWSGKATEDVAWWRHQMKPFPAWIPRTKASNAELWCFLWSAPWLSTQSWGWWFETPTRSLWRHCNVIGVALFVGDSCLCIIKWHGYKTGNPTTPHAKIVCHQYQATATGRCDWKSCPEKTSHSIQEVWRDTGLIVESKWC